MSHDRTHELLPWFVAGTLDANEAEGVRRHVERCQTCRDELDLLERMREQIERHGDEFLSPHPEPDRLVGAIRGEIDGPEREAIFRHVALCVDCATESSWVRGASVAEPRSGESRRPTARRFGRVVFWRTLAAAGIVLAAVVVPFALRDDRPTSDDPWQFVRPVERSGGAVPELVVGRRETRLVFEVDVPPDAFPVTLTVHDESGKVVADRARVAREDLEDALYLRVSCPRETCPSGEYTARIRPVDGRAPELTFRFRLGPGDDAR